jgi:hypothetical protein
MNIFLRKFICCISLLIFSWPLAAQQNNTWIFGNHAAIDFNSGAATPFYNSEIDAYEGTAVASDNAGNLLFYSDGIKVWNKNNQLMPNGNGLGGGSSSTSVLLVQKPGSCSRFYICTTEDHTENGDLYYSEIDMCLDGGLGDVVPGQKAIFLITGMSEKLCAIKHSNGNDAWLISHKLNSSDYVVLPLTNSGFGNSVAYPAGSYLDYNMQSGYLKANSSGTKLALGLLWSNVCEVVNFDPSTGVVSGAATNYGPAMTTNTSGLWYGLEFSPNEQFLYATRAGFGGTLAYLYQVDLTTGFTTLLSSSPIPVDYYYGALRLAPDGKIYMAKSSAADLGVINEPDIAGSGCNYVDAGLLLSSNTTSNLGLPLALVTIPSSTFTVYLGNDTSVCDPLTLTVPASCGTNFLWQDGSADSSFVSNGSGTYWVTASNSCGTAADTITISSLLQSFISGDTVICEGQSVTLTASPADTYLWNTGSTSQIITDTPEITMEYSVILATGNCADTAYITVQVASPPKISFSLEPDTICVDLSSFLLTGGLPSGGSYSGDGVSNNIFDPAVAGVGAHDIYYSYSDANGCSDTVVREIVVENCTGIGEIKWQPHIAVFPTVTDDLIMVSLSDKNDLIKAIKVINTLGVVILEKNNLTATQAPYFVSLGTFPAGIYYVVIQADEMAIAKIIRR